MTPARDHKWLSRRSLFEMALNVALLVAAFVAIAAADVSVQSSHAYWLGLTVVYGLAAFAMDRLHGGHALTDMRDAGRVLLHWLGVLVAVHFAYYFVTAGRMADADAGLTYGLILALGTFTAGVHGNWRLMVVGAAVGLATVGVALVEQYLWVLVGIAAVMVLVLVFGGRLSRRLRAGKAAGA